jgi:hypothetical protein
MSVTFGNLFQSVVSFGPTSSSGPFNVPHGLVDLAGNKMTPTNVNVMITGNFIGAVTFQNEVADVNNAFLIASSPGITGFVVSQVILRSF